MDRKVDPREQLEQNNMQETIDSMKSETDGSLPEQRRRERKDGKDDGNAYEIDRERGKRNDTDTNNQGSSDSGGSWDVPYSIGGHVIF